MTWDYLWKKLHVILYFKVQTGEMPLSRFYTILLPCSTCHIYHEDKFDNKLYIKFNELFNWKAKEEEQFPWPRKTMPAYPIVNP